MKALVFSFLFNLLLGTTGCLAMVPLTGLYQTIDDETDMPKSIVMLYEYKDGNNSELAGRIVALYDEKGNISETLAKPVKLADKVKGSPKYVGLDIIWGMEWDYDDNEYQDGKIMDPKKGKVYSSVIWQDNKDKVRVRGKIGPFGRTQTWNVLTVSDLPAEIQTIDTTNWKPIIRD